MDDNGKITKADSLLYLHRRQAFREAYLFGWREFIALLTVFATIFLTSFIYHL